MNKQEYIKTNLLAYRGLQKRVKVAMNYDMFVVLGEEEIYYLNTHGTTCHTNLLSGYNEENCRICIEAIDKHVAACKQRWVRSFEKLDDVGTEHDDWYFDLTQEDYAVLTVRQAETWKIPWTKDGLENCAEYLAKRALIEDEVLDQFAAKAIRLQTTDEMTANLDQLLQTGPLLERAARRYREVLLSQAKTDEQRAEIQQLTDKVLILRMVDMSRARAKVFVKTDETSKVDNISSNDIIWAIIMSELQDVAESYDWPLPAKDIVNGTPRETDL